MSSCVNTESTEFKKAVRELGISPMSLEPIIHEYLNTPGNDNSFPSNLYILSKLGIGLNYMDTISEVAEIYAKKYSEPLVFPTKAEFDKAYKEASLIFPEMALSSYVDNKGQHVLLVRSPIVQAEMKQILDRAPRDIKGRLLAPNGKPSNLNETLYALVRTKAFKKWFGDWEAAAPSPITLTETHKSGNINHNLIKYDVVIDGEKIGSIDLGLNHKKKLMDVHFVKLDKKGNGQKLYRKLVEQFPGYTLQSDTFALSQDAINMWERLVEKGQAIKRGEKDYYMTNETIRSNVSKVVDENGEPLVVYHNTLSIFNTFRRGESEEIMFHFGTLRSANDRVAKGITMPVFLNIRNMQQWEDHIHEDRHLIVKRLFEDGLITKEQFLTLKEQLGRFSIGKGVEADNWAELINNALKQNGINDFGISYVNQLEGVGDVSYAVTNPNQIKSADFNSGEFSAENGNVYLNKTTDLFNVLKGIKWVESPRRGTTLEHSLVRSEGGQVYITVGEINNMSKAYDAKTAEDIVNSFKLQLINHGISPNAVKITLIGNAFRLESNDSVPKDQSRLLSARSIEHVLAFLETKIPGLNHRVIRENSPLLERMGVAKNAKAFFDNGTVYLIEGRFNLDIAIEECLHPLVNAIRLQNSELFESLVKEAKENFPTLAAEISKSYSEADFNAELVTQALSRAMSKEFKENGIGKSKLSRFVNKFLRYIKNLFGETSIGDIKPTTTFEELAKIINTEDAVFNIDLGGREYHLGESALDRMLTFSRDNIRLDPATHRYTVNGKRVDMSVTEWVHRNEPREDEVGLNLGYLEVSGHLGTTHDSIARDFLGEKLKSTYPNMSKQDIEAYIKSLEKFKQELDNKFGKGKYRIITDEDSLRLAGTILTPDGVKTIAGTMDMMIIDENGNYYIYDFKTKRANSNGEMSISLLTGYSELTSMYRDLIEANHPELEGKFGGSTLVLINLKYDAPRGSRRNEVGRTDYRLMSATGQIGILADGRIVPIQDAAVAGVGNYSAGIYHKTIPVTYRKAAEIGAYPKPTNENRMKSNTTSKEAPIKWGRTSENSYEVSTAGDKRFSALVATFSEDVTIEGITIPKGTTIEEAYQKYIKKSSKGKAPSKDSILYREGNFSKEEAEDFSYERGYLPLWRAWAKQHPELIRELKDAARGKTLTDRFANTKVSQARALSDILNAPNGIPVTTAPVGTTTQVAVETETKPVQKTETAAEKEAEARQKIIDEYLAEQLAFTKRIDALLSSNIIKASEVRNIAEQIVYWISDHITSLFEDPKEIKRMYNVEIDPTGLSRVELVSKIGVDNIIEKAKDRFKSAKFSKRSTSRKAALVAENFRALIVLANDVFFDVEKFAIKYNEKGQAEANTDMNPSADDINQTNDMDDIAEKEGDTQEHWQIESRTQDILTSMSQLVRAALMQCYILVDNGKTDELGNPLYDNQQSEFGINERINVRQATQSILRWTQGCLTYSHMLARLENKAKDNLWLNAVVARLKDKSGKEADFQSQFFSVFSKHFQSYSIVVKEEGKYKTIPVNERPALKEAMNSITVQYKVGEHPFFTPEGISEKYLKEFQESMATLMEARKTGLTEENRDQAIKDLAYITALFGYAVSEDMIKSILNEDTFKQMVDALKYIENTLLVNKNNKEYNPFNYKDKKGSINGNLRNFLSPITDSLEDIAISSFYDSGKMYQSYVTPSYMTKLMNKFKLEGKEFTDFIQQEYADFEWFNTDKTVDKASSWLNVWLEKLATKAGAKEVFAHKVQLNFNKHNYMRNMSDMEYALSLFTEYFFEEVNEKDPDLTRAWFRVPMLSNKPSSEFIRFYSYRGTKYKTSITSGMKLIFDQELMRIKTVMMRNLDKSDPRFIKNFDKNGKKFCFLEFMNDYLTGEKKTVQIKDGTTVDVHALIQKTLKGKQLTIKEEGNLNAAVKNIIYNHMNNSAATILREWRTSGVLQGALDITNLGSISTKEMTALEDELQKVRKSLPKLREALADATAQSISGEGITADEAFNPVRAAEKALEKAEKYEAELQSKIDAAYKEVEEKLENFIWNDAFAAMNIMQLTITDIAYYKDAEDLQKRLAQIHAPGIRANTEATDYGEWDAENQTFIPNNAKPVTDGKMRTFYLTDFDDFISNIVDNISVVFNRKIKAAKTDDERKVLIALRDSLISKEKDENGNYIGAYYNINVADAQGYSSPTSYRKKALMFGKWSKESEIIYQKLISGKYTYNDLKTAFQPLKPFVYTQVGKSSGVPNAPISTLKVGIQNKNSEYLLILADAILQGEDTGKPNILRAVFEVMEESAKRDPIRGIDTVQFESTVKAGLSGRIDIKQYIKLNMKGGEAAAKTLMEKCIYGEDGKYNETFVHEIPAEDYCIQQEVPEHFKNHDQAHGSQIRFISISDLVSIDAEGKEVKYAVEGKEYTAEEFKREYEETIAGNIREDIARLEEELGLNRIDNKVERNIALSKILRREIMSNPRYGVDLLIACSLDENGEFRIPLGDPIQAKRVEQLINSILKNNINKQKIAGGPIVQVSNFGTSRELNIRFNSKTIGEDGKPVLLKTRAEFEADIALKTKYKTFEDYIDAEQAGIAYFEVFASIYSNELFEKFADENGNIDIAAIEATNPELLMMVGYRIPTEAKYSAAPLKIVGFLPREAGDGIMLPYDITTITGSDFDIDKEYVMRYEMPIERKKFKEIVSIAKERMKDELAPAEMKKFLEHLQDIHERVKMTNDMQAISKGTGLYAKAAILYRSIAYKTTPPISGKAYRNNKIISMTIGVLTHETSAEQMLNPGGFDPQKRMGYMVSAFKMGGYTWEQLQGMTINQLKDACYTSKNLSYIDTHIKFYKQNAAAGSLIGRFAVHRIAHAVLESNGYNMDINTVCGAPFKIAGIEFSGKMTFDMMYDIEGNLIGKTLGSLVASAADAVKDPVLNLMNINESTSNILTTLIRFGMPFEIAAMLLSQDVVTRALNRYSRENITGFKTFNTVISDMISEIINDYNIGGDSKLWSEELTMREMINGIKSSTPEIDFKVLTKIQAVLNMNNAMKGINFATRLNSISNSVGPLIIDNLIMESEMIIKEEDEIYDSEGRRVTFEDVLKRHPILKEFARVPGKAKEVFGNMPANSTAFRNILRVAEGSSLENTLFNDRTILSKLSDFYQSYMLVASGVVKPSQLARYIEGFPKYFIKSGFKEKYSANALIQAIKVDTLKNGRAVLKINLTGMDTQQKETLSSAWIDLHKVDPELSKMLFMYNFFRGGIGFSPKTFMGLVPTYVKEMLEGYVNSYRYPTSVASELVLDQFVRNNADNNKLVPIRKPKGAYDVKTKTYTITEKNEVASLKNLRYFKVLNLDGSYTLYKNTQMNATFAEQLVFEEVSILGNNKEYIELSTEDIFEAAEVPVETWEQNLAKKAETKSESKSETKAKPEVKKETLTEDYTETDPNNLEMVSSEEVILIDPSEDTDTSIPRYTEDQKVDMIIDALAAAPSIGTKMKAIEKWSEFKARTQAEKSAQKEKWKEYFKGKFEKFLIPYNENTVDDIYETFCG